MIKDIKITVPPEIGFDEENLKEFILNTLNLNPDEKVQIKLTRRSVDARQKRVKVNIEAKVYVNEDPGDWISYRKNYHDVSKKSNVVIVGSGPAGLFAALRFLELGIKPVILERGKDVRARRRDIAAINKKHIVNEDSNYCFGEGGAGAYSDGKLFTRSKRRGDTRRIMEILVAHGADPYILVESHPHIGTNRLPAIIANIRESILDAGGEIHFKSRVTDLILDGEDIRGVVTNDGQQHFGQAVILGTGHSARDIFKLLNNKNIRIETKPYALGIRIEHPQHVIDRIQYHCNLRGDYLPAASYSLATQVSFKNQGRGVFSFCMCPGGFIVPSATSPGEIVVNGMSPSRRDSLFANSGIVVTVDENVWSRYAKHGALAGMMFQQSVEKKACEIAGGTQRAPAQRMNDFVNKKVSSTLLDTSYQPGLESVDMDEVLPPIIAQSLRRSLQDFGRKMKGYLTNEAQLIGVESRTSSPVRIPRDKETCEHIQVRRLFPTGEGAGYAGGIASAAMDGERCAESCARMYFEKEIYCR